MKTEGEDVRLQAQERDPEEINSADILISDFWPPELWEVQT